MISKHLATLSLGWLLLAAQRCAADREEATPRDNFIMPTVLHKSDYGVSVDSISLNDVTTDIADIASIHNGRPFNVIANLKWEEQIFDMNSTNALFWEMFVNENLEGTGSMDLNLNRALPSTIDAGSAAINESGSNNIKVKIRLDTIPTEK